MIFIKKGIFLVFIFCTLGLCAQESNDSIILGVMEEILLTDIRSVLSKPWSYQKDTTSVIDIYQNNVRQLFDRQVGVQSFNGENFAQDVRISIRGYGSRSAFGVRGIRLYQDGIPLTSPDGTSQMDEISIFDIEELDVVRSGLAARLGNSGGGALSLRSNSFFNGLILNSRINSLGSYDAGIKYGIIEKKLENLLSVNFHSFTGRRDFSAAQNATLYNKVRFKESDKWQLDFIQGAYYSPQGQDPGALTVAEFDSNRYQANSRNIQYNAGESVKGVLAAIKSIYQQSEKSSWITNGYYRLRDFTGRLPFLNGGWVDLDRHFVGINNSYEYRYSNSCVFTLGQSAEYQTDRRTLAKNNNGQKESTSSDQHENVLNLALYQQLHFSYSNWNVHQMLRYDRNKYNLTDLFLQDGLQNGANIFNNINGSIGVGYKINQNLDIFTHINSAFEMPTLNELTNNPEMTGGFNKSLTPEKSFQSELGAKWSQDKYFQFSTSFYHIRIKDQIVGYELASIPGRVYYRNAAITIRNGVEMNTDWNPSANFNIRVNYNWSGFIFRDYKTSGIDYTGNFQPLVPVHKINIGITSDGNQIIRLQVNAAFNSKMYLDDANKTMSKPFYEINATINSGLKISKIFTFGITANNLFNLMDYSNFRSNAAAQRYYEAASPMHFGFFLKYMLIRD